jgi:hypothetical protein
MFYWLSGATSGMGGREVQVFEIVLPLSLCGTGACCKELGHAAGTLLATREMMRDSVLLLAAACFAEDNKCASQLEQLKKLVQDVQGIVNYGSVNAAAADVAASDLKSYGVDEAALQADGCALQMVLIPFGDDKDDVTRYDATSARVPTG